MCVYSQDVTLLRIWHPWVKRKTNLYLFISQNCVLQATELYWTCTNVRHSLTTGRTWLLSIMRHWSKWWRSMVDVVYNCARGEPVLQKIFWISSYSDANNNKDSIASNFIWKLLFVPRWSKSWQRQAIIRDRTSISPRTFHHCVP
jgi:hypothetical protein